MSEESSNPFLKLFGGLDVQCGSSEAGPEPSTSCSESSRPSEFSQGFHAIAEDIFGISFSLDNESLKTGRVTHLVYIEEISSALEVQDLDALKLAVFERILLEDPTKHVIKSQIKNRNDTLDPHIIQSDCMRYLYECFRRLKALIDSNDNIFDRDTTDSIFAYIVEYVSTALRQPSLFEGQNIYRQVIYIVNFYRCTDLFSLSFTIIFPLTNVELY